jgi:hypothetical protein
MVWAHFTHIFSHLQSLLHSTQCQIIGVRTYKRGATFSTPLTSQAPISYEFVNASPLHRRSKSSLTPHHRDLFKSPPHPPPLSYPPSYPYPLPPPYPYPPPTTTGSTRAHALPTYSYPPPPAYPYPPPRPIHSGGGEHSGERVWRVEYIYMCYNFNYYVL